MIDDDQLYLCGCGHEFPEFLGAYGCPNCEGDEGGPGELLDAITSRAFIRELAQEYGLRLSRQPDGSLDLCAHEYQFARALIAATRQESYHHDL